MMKVAIITMSNGVNYGNRLQNYAMQEVLRYLGCEVETIKNYTEQKICNEQNIKWRVKHSFLAFYEKKLPLNVKLLNYKLRGIKFRNFTKKYVKQTEYIITDKNIDINIDKLYDYFVCGSDQIWNPEFKINSEIDFLTFASKGKRIAYAPSFGVSELECKYSNKYTKLINGIDHLSVREQAGAKIIKELTDREAVVLVDPTLLLSKSDWLQIEEKPNIKITKKYILTYFLVTKDDNAQKKIKKIAEKNNLEIINMMDLKNKHNYAMGPSEFIWLINNCELFCTDSFHGSVFSLIFKKPFIVFERKDSFSSMNSRLDTLLSLFNMKDRMENRIKENEIFQGNFTNVDKIIEKEKNKSIKYLKNALNINSQL